MFPIVYLSLQGGRLGIFNFKTQFSNIGLW